MTMSQPITLRPARVDEAAALSALTRRSKQSHGYSDDFMALFMSFGDMVITPELIAQNPVMVAEIDGQVAGFAHLKPLDEPDTVCLEDLFIEPDAQGKGVGRALFDWALATAAERGYDWLEWESTRTRPASTRRWAARRSARRNRRSSKAASSPCTGCPPAAITLTML